MKVTLEREGKNVVKLNFELESEKLTKAYEQACRQIGKQVRIHGFRPGKAPRMVIEKNVGTDYIKNETLQNLVPELLNEALFKENLDIITQPEYSNIEFNLGEPLKFEAKFEVRPEVKLGDYKSIQVNVPEVTLPEDAMERALKNVAETRSELKAVEGRETQMGDTVVFDFECKVDGKVIEGGKAESMVMELKESSFLPGFCEQLVGKKAKDEFQVKATFPETYQRKEVAGKEAEFDVKLKEIRLKETPAIDDELAKAVGYENLEALKESVKAELEEVVKQENEARAQRMVVEAVAHCAEVEIPDTMVERERDLLMQQMQRHMESQGQDWEGFASNPEFESVKASKLEEARMRVLTSLVLGAVVREEKLTISDEEMGPYYAQLVMQYNLQPEQYERFTRNEEVRRQVAEEVLTGKVVEFLVSQAKISYVPDECTEDHDHSAHGHGHSHAKEEGKSEEKKADTKKAKKKAE